MGIRSGLDPSELDQAGWGLILAEDEILPIKEALAPLLALRQEQAGDLFRVMEGKTGYHRDESKPKFLSRHGAAPGPVDPSKMPYYLLIAGSPEAIPYHFQLQLDVQHAVGRIDFGNDMQAYRRYAETVVNLENGGLPNRARSVIFGVSHPGDQYTNVMADFLVKPLSDELPATLPDWEIETMSGSQATKLALQELLGGFDAPSLLLACGHGLSFPSGHPRQKQEQGALLCHEWPGPYAGRGEIPDDHYFAAQDIDPQAELNGMLLFLNASFSAGTPQNDETGTLALGEPTAAAARPFVADLPRKLLAHPQGGAAAVIGTIDRVLSNPPDRAIFQTVVEHLLQGAPAGLALEAFNERYAEISTEFDNLLQDIMYGATIEPLELSTTWAARNDARSLVIVGDPAVRVNQAYK